MRGHRLLVLATALAACGPTSSYQPRVDLAGSDPARYETDLRDCKRAAEQSKFGPVIAGATIGASLGAAFGFVVGALVGVGNLSLASSYGAASGTEPGTLVGAAQSSGQPIDEPELVDQCLRNNGYKVADGM
ncbi:MAG TPA: hypothetical protein VJO12_16155 [Stellaceae bacterium]|nr:hypothetical protein [Stellaceae bacterium]